MAEEDSEHIDANAGVTPSDPWDENVSELPPPPTTSDSEGSFDEGEVEVEAGDDEVGDGAAFVDDGDLPAWMTKAAPGKQAADASQLLTPDADGLVPVSPAMAARGDNTAAAIGALSMRIDGLIAATTTYRSVMSDRLTEYADLVNRLNRTQASDLDEFRKTNERTVGEIRRTMGDSEDAMRTMVGQSEQLITDLGSLAEFVHAHSADTRELTEATDKLGRFVTGALDQFAERVLGELRALSDTVIPELGTMRSELAVIRESLDALNERTSNAPVREAIDELRADFSGLRRAVIEWPDLEVARAEIVAMRADLTSMIEEFHDQGGVLDHDDIAASVVAAMGPQVDLIGTEVAALRDHVRDLASQVSDLESGEFAAPSSSGAVSTAAIESLRDEIKALRRRIQVRAPD
jgi:hypothetical protein